MEGLTKYKCWVCKDQGLIMYCSIVGETTYTNNVAHCICVAGLQHQYDGRKVREHPSEYYIPSVEDVVPDIAQIAVNNMKEALL